MPDHEKVTRSGKERTEKTSWKKTIADIVDRSPRYSYTRLSYRPDSYWYSRLPFTAHTISQPLKGDLPIEPGIGDFVIVRSLTQIKGATIILGKPNSGDCHG